MSTQDEPINKDTPDTVYVGVCAAYYCLATSTPFEEIHDVEELAESMGFDLSEVGAISEKQVDPIRAADICGLIVREGMRWKLEGKVGS